MSFILFQAHVLSLRSLLDSDHVADGRSTFLGARESWRVMVNIGVNLVNSAVIWPPYSSDLVKWIQVV